MTAVRSAAVLRLATVNELPNSLVSPLHAVKLLPERLFEDWEHVQQYSCASCMQAADPPLMFDPAAPFQECQIPTSTFLHSCPTRAVTACCVMLRVRGSSKCVATASCALICACDTAFLCADGGFATAPPLGLATLNPLFANSSPPKSQPGAPHTAAMLSAFAPAHQTHDALAQTRLPIAYIS